MHIDRTKPVAETEAEEVISGQSSFLDQLDIGRTMRAAYKEAETDVGNLVKASEIVHLSPVNGVHLSVGARKILNMMIHRAAGNAWRDELFSISKKELRGTHKSNKRITKYINELMSALVTVDCLSPRGKEAKASIHLLEGRIEENDDTDGLFYFKFHHYLRAVLQKSQTYAVLNMKTVHAFESQYSLIMYEICSQRIDMRRPDMTLKIEDIRKVFNIPENKYPTFAGLYRRVLEGAQKEVNALAPFVVELEKQFAGKKVIAVRFKIYRNDQEADELAGRLLNLNRDERRALVNRTNADGKTFTQIAMALDMEEKAARYGLN